MTSNITIEDTLIADSGPVCLYFQRNGQRISPWHDLPLWADRKAEILNMVVEIPRGANAKMEITKEITFNPIKQDIRDGKPREVADVPPFQGYPCNYGAIPQTWEDPTAIDPYTGVVGDDDPLDICEIGTGVAQCGEVKKVKPLGAFVVLDEGSTDWKIIAVDVTDAHAESLADIQDVETQFPGFLESLKTWYCVYKVPDGRSPNRLALDGRLMNRQFALRLIGHCHEAWKPRKGFPNCD
ncbi:inorganic pyrophosphatase [Aspergillus violaceofuscus CBS 115571]|uniref:inorganic diphosphatase n=1 Tax=Aspergillus violaceofuscus (strain CBS 115571) TaxID=1450538 RepID=A0A2V5H0U6_ASPV1|nr:inorganic pyrophosphatase [Aspergillus violaceofuscus CBS 115571]